MPQVLTVTVVFVLWRMALRRLSMYIRSFQYAIEDAHAEIFFMCTR